MSEIKEKIKIHDNRVKNILPQKIKKINISKRINLTRTDLSLMSKVTESSRFINRIKTEKSQILEKINELQQVDTKSSQIGLFQLNSQRVKFKENERMKIKLKIKDESLGDKEKCDPILERLHNIHNKKSQIEDHIISTSEFKKSRTKNKINIKKEHLFNTPEKNYLTPCQNIKKSVGKILENKLPHLNHNPYTEFSKLNNTQRNTTQNKLTLNKLEKMSPSSKKKVLENNLLKSFTKDLESFEKLNKLKLSPNIYKTEVRIREDINNNIHKLKSQRQNGQKSINNIANQSKFNLSLFNSLSYIDSSPIKPSELVNETYHQIRKSRRVPKFKMLTKEEIMEIKNITPSIIPRSNLFEINQKLSSTSIAKDSTILSDIYNQNIIVLKKFIQKKLDQEKINN